MSFHSRRVSRDGGKLPLTATVSNVKTGKSNNNILTLISSRMTASVDTFNPWVLLVTLL